jgi:SHS2 domain-containing protein
VAYSYVDNVAGSDAAFEATGRTMEELFVSAWNATLNTMIENPESIDTVSLRSIRITAREADLLLHDFLQKLIFFKDATRELLMVKRVRLIHTRNRYKLRARLMGEPIDTSRHNMIVDIKAVTLYRLAVVACTSGWRATVVLDV